MPSLLADANADAHLDAILAVCESPYWREFWESLAIQVYHFADLGLDSSMPDDRLWEYCQQRNLVLLTSNRNSRGPTSLQATIASKGEVGDLPVFTMADADRVLADRAHAEDVAVRMMELLDEIDWYRGSGRLWLP